MKSTFKFFLLAFCSVPLFLSAQQFDPNSPSQNILNKSSHNFFIENKGQWPKEVRYLAKIGGMNAWITNKGVVYDYYQLIRNYKPEQTLKLPPNEKQEFEGQHSSKKGHVVNIVLECANTEAKSVPSGMQESYNNYFIGNDSTKWASFVRLYSEVLIQDIYPGIDIRFYFDNNLIRYDYIAKPGADLAQINIKIKGSDGYKINEKGELTLKTSLGKITHGKLYAYQNIGNKKTEIACSFIKNRGGKIGVSAENYDPAFALVIDPLVYSTFIGGSNGEASNSIAIDSAGNTFITGNSSSSDFPTTTGAYDVSINGSTDVFITKLNASGSALVYSTYIGGSGQDIAKSISIDSNGNAYIVGNTQSTNYATTTGAYDISYGGGNYDVIVSKLNASGSALSYSTYIGGNGSEDGYSIVTDVNGNAIITGVAGDPYPASPRIFYPTTSGAYDVSMNGASDVFVTKFNSSGSALVYSTFIGGYDGETANSIAIDSAGNVFITGITSSTNYPTTSGAYDVSFNGGIYDIFVTKFNTSCTSLIYSTYIGGANNEYSNSITIDRLENVYITGSCVHGSYYPGTSGAYNNYSNPQCIIVTKLNSSGSALVYSSKIGGNGTNTGNSISIDSDGNAIVTGYTTGTDFPTTNGAFDKSINGQRDIVVFKFNSSGSNLLYSTFIGGNNPETALLGVIDKSGNVYFTGNTTSNNYPTTPTSYDISYNGGTSSSEGFVTKMLAFNQGSNINLSNNASTSVKCSWSKGGGTKRAVFIKQSGTGNAFPINSNTYVANNTFGLGSQIDSSGWYCIYNDTGLNVNISGLLPNISYRIMICEYIGSSGNENYNTDSVTNNPKNFTTLNSIQANNIKFNNFATNRITVSWINGNGFSRVVFISAGNTGIASPSNDSTYIADSTFGLGTQIGNSGWYCVYNGTGNQVNIFGLSANTPYRIMVCEYNFVISKEKYITQVSIMNPRDYYPIPTLQANNISFSNVKAYSIDISWTNGNGTKRAVFILSGDTGSVFPINYKTYTGDTIFGFGSQVDISKWYCVYNGTASSVSVSCLLPNNAYRVMICEYNGLSGEETYNIAFSTYNPSIIITDFALPSKQASGINFSNITSNSFTANWMKGNGTSRAVFVKATNTGSALLVDNTTYSSDTVYKFGSQIDTTGWYCVYTDTGTTVTISNLNPKTTYRLMVCDFNGTTGHEKYNLTNSNNNPANITTDYSIPSIQSVNISFSNITDTTVKVNWSKGNGTSRAVFIKANSTGSPNPISNTTYSADTVYGSGSQIGISNWYCVYNDTGASVTISNLSPNTTYRLMVCDFNGTIGKEKYNVRDTTNNPANITSDFAVPSIQSNGIGFTNVLATSLRATWSNGNGKSRAVFIKATNTGSAIPVNKTTYTADTGYSFGSQIGTTGWFCVYNDTGSSVNISNLQPGTTYMVMVCEYNGTLTNEVYNFNTATNNPNYITTLFAVPDIQATDITFNNILNSDFTLSWSNGSGSKRAVFILEGNSGNTAPNDNTTYSANTSFNFGSQIGTTGWYCVYNDTGSSVAISNLQPNTTYRVMVCEYNGTSGNEVYNITTSTNNPNNATTLPATPTIQALKINFSNIAPKTIAATCTKGNGTKRAIFIKAASSGSALPVNNTTYIANTIFGTGTQIGTSGWYCVYNDTGRTVNITGLLQNTNYTVMACEYNGTAGSELYNTTTATNNPNSTKTTVGINEKQLSKINIYPNPTNGQFVIENAKGCQLTIFNSLGKTVYISTITVNSYTADLKNVSDGVYFLKLEKEGKLISQEIILRR